MNLKPLLSFALALALACHARPARANLNFNLIPDPGTPQSAIDGFAAAANRWSSLFADNITVNVQIGFSSLGPSIIGQAGSDFREHPYANTTAALATRRTSADDFSSYAALQPGASFNRLINHTSNNPNGANSATPYVDSMNRVGMTTANAKVLGLLGPTLTLDGLIRFNSDFGFDFDPGNGITAGQFDFVGVATHELGHALGFISGVDDIDTSAGAGAGGSFSSNLIDLFRFSTLSLNAGVGYSDYTADNRVKFFSTDGGASQIALFANGQVYGDGNQASHWKDFLGIGIMDPTAFPGELLTITENDRRLFDVLGYTLVPEPGGATLLVASLVLIRRRLCQPRI